MTPEMTGAAKALENFYATMGAKGQAAGILPDDLIEHYATHLWTGLNKNDSIMRNMINALGMKNLGESPGMAPRSRLP